MGRRKARPGKTEGGSVSKAARSNYPPEGDKRLTINISAELHLKLKMAAVMAGTTIGELVEKFAKTKLDEMLRHGIK
jgi:hypothetical protein